MCDIIIPTAENKAKLMGNIKVDDAVNARPCDCTACSSCRCTPCK